MRIRWEVHAAGKNTNMVSCRILSLDHLEDLCIWCNIKMGLREIHCSDVELIYLPQE